jgi:hypothetical protein
MPGHHYTPAEYAPQQKVIAFGNLAFQLEEHCLIDIQQVVIHFDEIETIRYLVLRYLNTGVLPFKEFFKEWLFSGQSNPA